MGIFEFIDWLIKVFGKAYDSGIFWVVLIVVGLLLIPTALLTGYFTYKHLTNSEPELTYEQSLIVNNAAAYCHSIGFDNWKWKNETNETFTCFNNSLGKSNISDLYEPYGS